MDKEQNAIIMFLFEYRNLFVVCTIYIYIYKGKVHPRTGHESPEGD